jgi:cellobiose dehydrogenase (acceptor)
LSPWTHADIFVKTDIQIAHPSIVFYDFYGAWNKPIASDVDAYLSNGHIP